ncbi:MAG: hypothetical protein KAT57_07390 [Candidatus Lokiarchaeota archaeon]|nr:hypothetical protein [Candidatus Lokiarchaeota archaeon]
MADNKDFTPQEYESIIDELMREKEALKKRIVELENRDQTYKVQPAPIKKMPAPIIEPETAEPVIFVEGSMKKEEIEPIKQKKEIVISESIFSQDVAPLEMGKGKILIGVSRRECPKCGNNNKPLIREVLDKTHIICDYPRMFGKKYHCGECGGEWRVPSVM